MGSKGLGVLSAFKGLIFFRPLSSENVEKTGGQLLSQLPGLPRGGWREQREAYGPCQGLASVDGLAHPSPRG